MTPDRDALERVLENLIDAIAKSRGCPFCCSSVHPDGHVSHAEDCSVPYVEERTGRLASGRRRRRRA